MSLRDCDTREKKRSNGYMPHPKFYTFKSREEREHDQKTEGFDRQGEKTTARPMALQKMVRMECYVHPNQGMQSVPNIGSVVVIPQGKTFIIESKFYVVG